MLTNYDYEKTDSKWKWAKKTQKYGHAARTGYFVVFTASGFWSMMLCLNLMMLTVCVKGSDYRLKELEQLKYSSSMKSAAAIKVATK